MEVFIIQVNYKSKMHMLFPCAEFKVTGNKAEWTALSKKDYAKLLIVSDKYGELAKYNDIVHRPLLISIDNIESIWVVDTLDIPE